MSPWLDGLVVSYCPTLSSPSMIQLLPSLWSRLLPLSLSAVLHIHWFPLFSAAFTLWLEHSSSNLCLHPFHHSAPDSTPLPWRDSFWYLSNAACPFLMIPFEIDCLMYWLVDCLPNMTWKLHEQGPCLVSTNISSNVSEWIEATHLYFQVMPVLISIHLWFPQLLPSPSYTSPGKPWPIAPLVHVRKPEKNKNTACLSPWACPGTPVQTYVSS